MPGTWRCLSVQYITTIKAMYLWMVMIHQYLWNDWYCWCMIDKRHRYFVCGRCEWKRCCENYDTQMYQYHTWTMWDGEIWDGWYLCSCGIPANIQSIQYYPWYAPLPGGFHNEKTAFVETLKMVMSGKIFEVFFNESGLSDSQRSNFFNLLHSRPNPLFF